MFKRTKVWELINEINNWLLVAIPLFSVGLLTLFKTLLWLLSKQFIEKCIIHYRVWLVYTKR